MTEKDLENILMNAIVLLREENTTYNNNTKLAIELRAPFDLIKKLDKQLNKR